MTGGWTPSDGTPTAAADAARRTATEREASASEEAATRVRERGLMDRLLRMYSRGRPEEPRSR